MVEIIYHICDRRLCSAHVFVPWNVGIRPLKYASLFGPMLGIISRCGMSHAASAFFYEKDCIMADRSSLPTSTSSLLLPLASQSSSRTLSSLKCSTLSISNRLDSIVHDSGFVQNFASSHGLPLIANERCGSWYIPPEEKAGSAYFKSTDGHWGQWGFSTRRLNLHLLDIIGRCGGWVRA